MRPNSVAPAASTASQPPNAGNPPPPPFSSQVPDKNIIASLQAQLAETQSTLASHVEKIRALNDLATEYDSMKREFSSLRDYIEENKHQSYGGHDAADEDDAKSFTTITPEREEIEEENEKQLQKHRQELVNGNRPHTPEPTQHLEEKINHSTAPATFDSDVTNKLATLSEQLETALSISRALQAQQASTQDIIQSLESKIAALEGKVDTVAEAKKEEKAAEPIPQPKGENGDSTSLLVTEPPILDLIKQWSSLHSDWGTRFDEWESRIVSVEGGHKNLEESLRTLEGGFRSVEDGLRSLENNMKESEETRQKVLQELQVGAQAKRQVVRAFAFT